MKKMLLALAVVMAVCVCGAKEYSSASDWPCEVKTGDAVFQIFEPSVELFADNNLRLRSAVAIQKTKESEAEPVYGAVWLTALSSNDTVNRKVTCDSLRVTKFKCPDEEDQEVAYAAALQSELSKVDMVLNLDYVLNLEKEEAYQTRNEGELKNDPPKILCVTNATVLVQIDGAPVMRNLDSEGKFEAVANTPYCLVFDTQRKCYYLKGSTYWLTAPTLQSAFTPASGVPDAVKEYGSSLELSDEEKESFNDVLKNGFPQIIVATEPTELICIDGTPVYKNVEGTDIMYAENTENDLFYCATDSRLYVLLSGRWYGHVKDSEWEYIPPDKLPSGFYKMTKENGKESALTSIKGTKEAKEAVEEAYVPQTVKVARKAEEVPEVVYDGTPQFKEIPEAYPVAYAVNTPHDVIRVNDRYYLCENAVWYESLDPLTGWKVCINVPGVIYTIPPAYPVYHVRYVRVYNYTPDYVYVGYYPGYVGCYVNNGVIVYGTGYRYAPWIGTYYYPWPATFGFGVSYSLGFGWGFNISWGAPMGWVGFGFCWSNYRWGWNHHPHWYGGHGHWWGPGCGPRHHHHVYHHHGRGCGNIYRSGDHCPGGHGPGGPKVGPGPAPKIPAGRYLVDEPVKSYNRPGTPAGQRLGSNRNNLPASNLRADKDGNVYAGRGSSRVGTPVSGSAVRSGSSSNSGSSRVGTTVGGGSTVRSGSSSNSGSSRVGTTVGGGTTVRSGSSSNSGSSRVGTTVGGGTTVRSGSSSNSGSSRVGTPVSGGTTVRSGSSSGSGSSRVGTSVGSGSTVRSGSSSGSTIPVAGRVETPTTSSGSSSRTATPVNQTRRVNNPSVIRNSNSGSRSGGGSTIRSGNGGGRSGSGASRQGVRTSSFTTPSVPSGFASAGAARSVSSGSFAGSAVRTGSGLGGGARMGSSVSTGARMGGGGGVRMGAGAGAGARMGGGGGVRMGGGGRGGRR
ncbi:hypothetical protein IKW72_04145 [bacterium]|nr:hypothetical protein [bacterium]